MVAHGPVLLGIKETAMANKAPGFGFDAIQVTFERLPLHGNISCEEKHRCNAQAEYVITIGCRTKKQVCRQAADTHARMRGFLDAEDACRRSGGEHL
jgi:hypothetical protein